MAKPEHSPNPSIPYTVIRSRRKTMALVLHPDNQLEVRCGLKMPLADIKRFVQEKEPWIRRKMTENSHLIPVKVPSEPKQMTLLRHQTRQKALMILQRFPDLVPGRLMIRRQKRRWGSCSKNGVISINLCAGLLPDELLEYIVVHELCHLIHFDHSPRFHHHLEQLLPGAQVRSRALQRYLLA
ncbi:MAG: DUF45 domain-containing protein [Clostridia bacterium]|nr:DUF45 domain-containing protein [Clostridia bacterium]NCC74919.1 DUF45 domain-containing protein [Clostridia bacterium]